MNNRVFLLIVLTIIYRLKWKRNELKELTFYNNADFFYIHFNICLFRLIFNTGHCEVFSTFCDSHCFVFSCCVWSLIRSLSWFVWPIYFSLWLDNISMYFIGALCFKNCPPDVISFPSCITSHDPHPGLLQFLMEI